MKKSVYAACGATMITVAVLIKVTIGGSLDLASLVAIGLALLIASADAPNARTRKELA